ncbi:MAG: FprA family A-type flavoprotein [Cellulosilyticaceae bacterium]
MNKFFTITPDLSWIGSLDPNLRVFDIVMETEFGTTYNAYVLKTSEGHILFETVKEKFFPEYLEKLRQLVNLDDIKYIIVNHTEPDHAGSVGKLLELIPTATVVGTIHAIKYLSNIIHMPFESRRVKDGETLALGNKTLRFLTVPQLHWPDTMYTYIEEDQLLVTCDSFGAHYACDHVLRSDLDPSHEADFLSAYKYYYDMIMGPFKPFVLSALQKIKDLELQFICPGHGLVLDASNMSYYMNLYKEWSQPQKRDTPSIVVPYVSAYGYTAELAAQIAEGAKSISDDLDVLLFDLVEADSNHVLHEISFSKGVIFGSPTILADALPPIWSLLTSLNPIIHKGLKASCFGSYGWSGEATKNIEQRLKQLKFDIPVEPMSICFRADDKQLEAAFEFGAEFARKVL